MVKIRYTGDLGDGQHACSRPEGRHIVVYVRDGLTLAERNAALRRERYRLAVPVLQQHGRHGRAGPLRTARVPFAAPRARRRGIQAGASAAAHPAWLTAGLLATAGVAVVLVVFTAATLTIRHFTAGSAGGRGPVAGGVPPPAHVARYRYRPAAAAQPAAAGHAAAPAAPATGSASTPAPAPDPPVPSGGGTGVTVRTPVLSATVAVSPAPLLPVQASAGPAGLCVHAGPLGVCTAPSPLPTGLLP